MSRDNSKDLNRQRLILLIRRIAREEVWQTIDEHLNDYEHKEKETREEDSP